MNRNLQQQLADCLADFIAYSMWPDSGNIDIVKLRERGNSLLNEHINTKIGKLNMSSLYGKFARK